MNRSVEASCVAAMEAMASYGTHVNVRMGKELQYGHDELKRVLPGLLEDLMHLCEREGVSFGVALARARLQFEPEE